MNGDHVGKIRGQVHNSRVETNLSSVSPWWIGRKALNLDQFSPFAPPLFHERHANLPCRPCQVLRNKYCSASNKVKLVFGLEVFKVK